MATILINAFFKDVGVPATGLSPTIDIWNLDTSVLAVDNAAMTEVGGGNYKYSFSSYDPTVNYSFIVDGTAILSGSDRYLQAGNDDPTILAPKLPTNFIMGSAVQSAKDDEIDAIKAKTDNLDAAVSSRAVPGDQMALTAAAIDAVFDELMSGHVVGGSFADFVRVIKKLLQNRYKHDGTTLTLYDDDSVTPLFTRTPKDSGGSPINSANYSQYVPAEVTRAE